MSTKFLFPNGQLFPAFPLHSGQVNIAAADGAKFCTMFCCAVGGDFTLTFPDGVIETITMVAGEVYAIPSGGEVEAVGAATFHFVR